MKWLYNFQVLLLAVATILRSQPAGRAADIQIRSDLVLIDAAVTNRRGQPITGLDASHFRLFEDGKEQQIQYCTGEDAPASIGLVLDASGSMNTKLPFLRKAVIRFVEVANPGDEYFLVVFRDHAELVSSFSRDMAGLLASIDRLSAASTTALFDGLQLGITEMRRAAYARKALLVVSDGLDNHSRFTLQETRKRAEEAGYPIYGIDAYKAPSAHRYTHPSQDTGFLEAISRRTGGRTLTEMEPKRMVEAAETISSEIRHAYVLGYVPSNRIRDGKYRRVQLRVDQDRVRHARVSHREGYYALRQ